MNPNGLIRTYLVFHDIPDHCEWVSQPMPLILEGLLIDFDASLRSLKDPKKEWEVSGTYRVIRRKLVYSSKNPKKMGLTQYLELKPEA